MDNQLDYEKLFDPEDEDREIPADRGYRLGDRRPDPVYVYSDRITLAVNIALATGRPLLLSGDPGTGKSSLAPHVAGNLGWRFLPKTISSRTRAADLLWTFDTIRRLSDAQAGEGHLKDDAAYLEPGVLWWAFDPNGAASRGLTEEERKAREVPTAIDPAASADLDRAVVLLDEIDKADPDVPNDLLEPLGSFRFRLDGKKVPVEAAEPPLVIITTNDERDLPRAFLRRCVCLTLPAPDDDRLLRIASGHFPDGDRALHEEVAKKYFEVREEESKEGRRVPSTAEYLDAVSACRELKLALGTEAWVRRFDEIVEATLRKRRKVEDHDQHAPGADA